MPSSEIVNSYQRALRLLQEIALLWLKNALRLKEVARQRASCRSGKYGDFRLLASRFPGPTASCAGSSKPRTCATARLPAKDKPTGSRGLHASLATRYASVAEYPVGSTDSVLASVLHAARHPQPAAAVQILRARMQTRRAVFQVCATGAMCSAALLLWALHAAAATRVTQDQWQAEAQAALEEATTALVEQGAESGCVLTISGNRVTTTSDSPLRLCRVDHGGDVDASKTVILAMVDSTKYLETRGQLGGLPEQGGLLS